MADFKTSQSQQDTDCMWFYFSEGPGAVGLGFLDEELEW